MNNDKTIWGRRVMFAAAMAGTFVASYLWVAYSLESELRCGPLSGCNIVRASQWSYMFGVPTPAFGVLFYMTVAAVLIFRVYKPYKFPKYAFWAQRALAFAGFAESLFLTFIQRFEIGTFCTWCLGSAACASVVFICTWLDRKSGPDHEIREKELSYYLYMLAFTIVVGGTGVWWLNRPEPITYILPPSLEQGVPDKIMTPAD